MAFLGGPLHFLPELKQAFIRTLKLTPATTVDPENSHLFAAMGAALESGNHDAVNIDSMIAMLDKGVEMPLNSTAWRLCLKARQITIRSLPDIHKHP